MKNLQKAKEWAKEEYRKQLKIIRIANGIARKAAPLLPEGWTCAIDRLFWLNFRQGTYGSKEKFDPNEFKLVCKIVEKITGKELHRDAEVNEETGDIRKLRADMLYYGDNVDFWVNVYLYNPKFTQDCEITWEETVVKKAIVSNHCLGLGN